jgi:hypothetical protein
VPVEAPPQRLGQGAGPRLASASDNEIDVDLEVPRTDSGLDAAAVAAGFLSTRATSDSLAP